VRLLIVVAALLAARGAGALEPGTVVDADHADQLTDHALPGVVAAVRRGLRIEVTAPRTYQWRRAYKEATEKYADQVRLGPDGELQNYVAGLPFPNVDAHDPAAAVKIMWNHALGPALPDDAQVWGVEWQFGRAKPGKPLGIVSQERNDSEHSRWLSMVERTEIDPRPALSDNQDGVRGMEVFGPTLPALLTMLRSGPMLTYRYLRSREDDVWYYISWDRKVRKLSAQFRYDATGGVVADLNSTFGYNGPVGSYTWRLVGEQTLLGVLHARRFPAEWCPGSGDFAPCDAWEERTAFVVEGTARTPYDIYRKRVVAIDRQSWVVLSTDLLDKDDKLWKTVLNFWSFRPAGDGGDEWPYLLAGSYLDVQNDEANRWRLPGTRPLAETVRFNSGLTREAFTTSALPHCTPWPPPSGRT